MGSGCRMIRFGALGHLLICNGEEVLWGGGWVSGKAQEARKMKLVRQRRKEIDSGSVKSGLRLYIRIKV